MRQSKLFTKTRREAPADEVAKNAQLLVRAGYIHKEMAGVYSYLPLGLRTLNNIVQIIREEMNAIGGQELIMTALQDKELWSRTDRWDDDKVGNWFKTAFKTGGETGLAITHEEPLTRIMTEHISSYRDLPVYAYQFQNKFRNELRAKSGIIRGKEFLMKDLYSFSKDEAEHKVFYDKAREAYKKVFERAGVGDRTYVTFASGGIFSEFSEEFQTVSNAGEDTIYVDEEKRIAVNKEVYTDEALAKLGLERGKLVEKRAIEVGNIFHLGTRFS
ncbi:MAG: aminoacyl--tRNA ligase-related protein, partial [Patescibacteria group bacterium]